MSDETWGNLPIPNIYIELEGNFVEFNEQEETLTCDFPVLSKFFNPMDVTLGGILDAYMDCTCLLYTSPSPRDTERSRMPSSA